MADDLADALRENAQGPFEAHGDSGGMRQHKLPEQIAADRYLEGKKATQGIGDRPQETGATGNRVMLGLMKNIFGRNKPRGPLCLPGAAARPRAR